MTMFGRDSIFTSLQALPFTPELAATTLQALGDWQGTRVDDFRDEDPGRILHEMRYGEMTAFEERPHSPYYGCADATPLYVVLLDEYERWTGDRRLVRELEHEARAALNWIDEYADLMDTGYIWYQRRNEKTGLENQCWKDSWDSISYRDGTASRLPASDLRAPGLRVRREDARRAAGAPGLEGPDARRQAGEGGGRPQAPLQPRLLGRGRRVLRPRARHRREQVDALASNNGHLLWSGIVDKSKAKAVAAAPDRAPAVLRLGRADAGRGRGSLQPDRLPRRHGLAVRQLVHRLGPAALRLQGGGRADRRRHPRRRRGLRRAAAGGIRRLRADGDEVPGAVPDGVQPAGLVDGHAAAAACARCSASSRSATTSSSTRRFPIGIGHLELLDIPGGGDGSTPSDVAAWTSRQGR